jgi:opacity protein-like surface antigen
MKRMKMTLIAVGAFVSATATAQAQEMAADAADPWTASLAPRVGLTVPTSKLGPMVAGGLEVGYALPVLNGQLVLAVDGTLTRPGYTNTVSDPRVGGEGEYELDVTELKLGLGLVYRIFGPEEAFVPFVGAGPALHMLRTTERNDFNPGENTAESSELGFEVVAGADYRMGPGYLLGEARVLYSDLDHLYTGDSNAGNVVLSVGYRAVF